MICFLVTLLHVGLIVSIYAPFYLNKKFIVKKLLISNNDFYLLSDNKYANQIKINSEMEFYVWGVVTYVIHKLSR